MNLKETRLAQGAVAAVKRSVFYIILVAGIIDIAFILYVTGHYGHFITDPMAFMHETNMIGRNVRDPRYKDIFSLHDLRPEQFNDLLKVSKGLINETYDTSNCDLCRPYNMSLEQKAGFPCFRREVGKHHLPICLMEDSSRSGGKRLRNSELVRLERDRSFSQDLTPFLNILEWNPYLHFIDVGAGVGSWSLIAASLGRRVMAVEPCEDTIGRLKMAAYFQGTIPQFTLIKNSVGDVAGNIYIRSSGPDLGCDLTHSITLDDLRHVSRNKAKINQAFLRINTKGFEPRLFTKAEKLFDEIDISLVLIDWSSMRKFCSKSYFKVLKQMINFLRDRRYEPFDFLEKRLLFYKYCHIWPQYVLWAKKKVKFTDDVFA